jgi:hypothetical protein
MQAGFIERVLAESAVRSLMLNPTRRARILAALLAEAIKLRAS